MGRGHGSTRDGVDGSLASDPGRLNAETGAEDIDTLAPVGEIGTAVVKSGGTDGEGLSSSSRRIVAGISVVIASSNGKVETSLDSSVDGLVKRRGLPTAERHIRSGTLEALALALLRELDLLQVSFRGPLDALHDIGHGTGAVGSENLDSIDIGLLGDTILLATNGTRAVSAVAIAIDVLVFSLLQ